MGTVQLRDKARSYHSSVGKLCEGLGRTRTHALLCCVALFLLLLSLIGMVSLSFRESLRLMTIPALMVASTCLGLLAAASVGLSKLRDALSALGRNVHLLDKGELSVLPETECHPDLALLVKDINELTSDKKGGRRTSFDTVASNRVLAKELTRVLQLLDSISEGMVMLDMAGRVAFANKSMADLLTVSPSEARQKHVSECLASPSLVAFLTANQGDGVVHHVRSFDLPPEEHPPRSNMRVLSSYGFDREGLPVGRILLCRDITEVKANEKVQTQFIDELREELQAPLQFLVDYYGKMAKGGPLGNGNVLEDVVEETSSLSQLLDDLMESKNLESGVVRLGMEPVWLAPVLEEVTEAARPKGRRKRVELMAELPDRLPRLNLDPRRFRAALRNVLDCAVHLTSPGSSVSVTTSSYGDEFHINIRDTGEGMSEEDTRRVFDRYFRPSSSTNGGALGTGLGLSTALKIIQLHGGDIRVSSRPGEGSLYVIILPRTLVSTADD